MPILVAAGLLAGAMNAIAGGGSFVTFPILVLLGLPSIAANATSTVALFPGTIASTWAYRDGLTGVAGVSLKVLLPISVAGGLIGALLLLLAPDVTFDAVVPWLLLLATLTFAGGRELGLALARRLRIGTGQAVFPHGQPAGAPIVIGSWLALATERVRRTGGPRPQTKSRFPSWGQMG